MSATPATAFFDQMTLLTGNTGGAVQSLPKVSFVGGKLRRFNASLVLASQTNGTVFGVARIPIPFVLEAITLITDTSLGSSTIKLGNAGNGNSAIYKAAATFTATDTPTSAGLTSTLGVEVTSGVDCQSGAVVTPYAPGAGGAVYEDIIMTVGGANLPSSGNLRIFFTFAID